jgi:N-acetylglucosamine-6-phosphate deacetylase
MRRAIKKILATQVLTPLQDLPCSEIIIADGKIAEIVLRPDGCVDEDAHVLNVMDGIVIPGLVDLQVNGALGWSFQTHDREHFEEILAFHLARGTTTLLPTLVTADKGTLFDSLGTLADFITPYTSGEESLEYEEEAERAREAPVTLPGIHLEGPFLSPEKTGAHDAEVLHPPDVALAQRFHAAAQGKLAIVTLAPELSGARDLISYFATQSTPTGGHVVVAAGHSAATYRQMQDAIASGLSFVTHAGNASDWPHRAMGELGFLTSQPGLVGSLMIEPSLGGSVILDGYHFHPALLAPLLRIKGPERLVLISDASPVAGCPPGEYKSGGVLATIHPQGFATSGRGGGWLAGSIITLLAAVQRAVSLAGLTLQEAVTMATLGPARWLGLAHRKGQIRVGADADFVILNRDLSLRHVIVGGQLLS